ncbi:MAG: type II toxin-antitoxin system RelE/ParE family toxin [Clostridiales bacterium]|nr:type II toxin-antitoxin system RelE/ParE family toxin [Clostridiales bacterium]
MLVSHAAFLAQVSVDVAEGFITAFETATDFLEIMPQRCPCLAGEYIPKNTYLYLLFEKLYLLVFQIQDDIVYADYVVDCRQDYSWLIH